MRRKGIGCLTAAVLLVAAGLGFVAWVLSTDVGDFIQVELKSRQLERRLGGSGVDHATVLAECDALMDAVGTNVLLVLKDHRTPTDPRVPESIRALEPDIIHAFTNQVGLAWYRQLGVCGLTYYAPGVDMADEVAAIEEAYGDTDTSEQSVRPVTDRVLFYSFRMNLLDF